VEVSVLLELAIPKLVPATMLAVGADTAPGVPARVLWVTKILELAVTAVVEIVIAPAVIAADVPIDALVPVAIDSLFPAVLSTKLPLVAVILPAVAVKLTAEKAPVELVRSVQVTAPDKPVFLVARYAAPAFVK
jgi:hypothetical protein